MTYEQEIDRTFNLFIGRMNDQHNIQHNIDNHLEALYHEAISRGKTVSRYRCVWIKDNDYAMVKLGETNE